MSDSNVANDKSPNKAIKNSDVPITWTPPTNIAINELGKRRNWQQLLELVKPLVDDLFVTNPTLDEYLSNIIEKFDTTTASGGWGICHSLVGNFGGNDANVLARLLAVGVNPDIRSTNVFWRPTHLCASNARTATLALVLNCRADLHAQTKSEKTPLQSAKDWIHEIENENNYVSGLLFISFLL
jgi:hypothetical protein